MTAIYKRELKSYFQSMTGYVLIAFLVIFTGIYFMAYNLNSGYPYFSYVLMNINYVLIIIIPMLTMRSFAEERKNKTDQLLLAAPVKLFDIVMGKYLAMVTVFAVPCLIFCIFPIIIKSFGTAYLKVDYLSILMFFLLGCVYLAIGMFLSSLTESQIIAAVITFGVLLLIYLWGGLIDFLPTSATSGMIGIVVFVTIAALIIYRMTGNWMIAGIIEAIGVVAVVIVSFVKSSLFENILVNIMKKLYLADVFDNVAYNKLFDVSGLILYLSVAGVFIFLNGTYSVGLAVIVIAIAIVINLVAGQLPEKVRNIDISSNNLYDISSVSTKMLKKLDKKVDLKVIAEQDSVDTRIKTFVKKYAALSGKVKVEWVDSVLHPSVLQKYNTDGNVIVVSCDATGKSTTISFSDIIQSDYYSYYTTGSASESSFDGEGQLTSAINYVTSEETSKIYRTSGHGEATFSSSVSDLLTKNNLETEEINLSMNPEIPDDCDLLFLYAPTSDITDDEKTIIEKYLSDGGKVYLILGDTTSDTPNLDGIMSDYGLKKVSGYIADTQRCYQGNYYAIFPQLSLSGDLGSGISNQMVLLLNSPGMEKTDTDNDNLTVTPFMQTSDSGYAVTENDQIQGQYILGAVSTNAISADSSDSDSEDEDDKSDATDTDTKTARLTVLASASMISSDITDQLTTLDNLTLFVNSVTENFDNVNNVAIEAKSLSTETNTPMHAGAFSILVIFIIPLAILILGFVIWMRRRKA